MYSQHKLQQSGNYHNKSDKGEYIIMGLIEKPGIDIVAFSSELLTTPWTPLLQETLGNRSLFLFFKPLLQPRACRDTHNTSTIQHKLAI